MTAVPPTGALSTPAAAWHTIDWYTVHRTVRRLQARLVKAVQVGRWGKVRALQHLLTHSFSGKAIAVKRVMCQHFSGQKISWVFKVCS